MTSSCVLSPSTEQPPITLSTPHSANARTAISSSAHVIAPSASMCAPKNAAGEAPSKVCLSVFRERIFLPRTVSPAR